MDETTTVAVEPGEEAPVVGASRSRTLVVAAVGVVIVAMVGFMAVRSADDSTGVVAPEAFSLPSASDGGRVTLADYRGKPVVVNFMASWCAACDHELPGFAKVSKELEGDVQFIGVASMETGNPLVLPRSHDLMWWPLARDVRGALRSGLHDALGGGAGMPLTAFYDRHGKLLEVTRTAMTEHAIRNKLIDIYPTATAGLARPVGPEVPLPEYFSMCDLLSGLGF